MSAQTGQTRARRLAAAVAVGVSLVAAAQPVRSHDGETARPGMTIHVDPQTGTILRSPAPGAHPLQLAPAAEGALSTSHQGLVEVSAPRPGGGVKIDLQGRFLSPLFATIDAAGNVKIRHLDHESPAQHVPAPRGERE